MKLWGPIVLVLAVHFLFLFSLLPVYYIGLLPFILEFLDWSMFDMTISRALTVSEQLSRLSEMKEYTRVREGGTLCMVKTQRCVNRIFSCAWYILTMSSNFFDP